MSHCPELTEVEKPFLDQLASLGWEVVTGNAAQEGPGEGAAADLPAAGGGGGWGAEATSRSGRSRTLVTVEQALRERTGTFRTVEQALRERTGTFRTVKTAFRDVRGAFSTTKQPPILSQNTCRKPSIPFCRSCGRFWSRDRSSAVQGRDSGRATSVLARSARHFGCAISVLARP